ncbi:UTP--glucose-1-phosphate uridylyltransferase GalU [Bacillus sp. 31A1R]|uniref:UTP--glucose-1-phosphate uridylyltransferase n=1 Tax=Robertmurraya mangrovi TaxID=3098077 RepID=A0ABU5IX42_9BACI|nr:UTP--glucose-1-phosphate uridylyltransferase GalU [Bacillus sp. 31A1R]MDZ5471714.1 UTP--glucose-1-phosphate uridylyltransferase GalU [Bacillus sp. 31A1R]
MTIRKAIIPAAGLGTRFLPATKAQPKEMLPIVDKPTIQYIVEEAVQSGIEDIIIISGRGKRAIEDHFDKSYELEETLAKKGKMDLLRKIEPISKLANIHYIRQKEPKGLGDAIYCARSFIGDEPFAVMLGDDIVQAETPCMKQLITVYNECGGSIVGVQSVSDDQVSKYGIIEPELTITDQFFTLKSIVEKPSLKDAPSNFAVMGRYILDPAIFSILENTPAGTGNEIQLTDAIQRLIGKQSVYSYIFEGNRYDVGDKLGFIKATIELSLKREDLREDLMQYIKNLIETEEGAQL